MSSSKSCKLRIMLVLGVETSCDETALALYDSVDGLLGDAVHSQADLHAEYGGVVPELASRDHLEKLVPVLETVLARGQRTLSEIDAVAYTGGPGLAGALIVGAGFARGLAWALKIPSLAVNHLEGHLFAPYLESDRLQPPFLSLLVSGGHSQFIMVDRLGSYSIIGESLDDAVGEAFDKVAKMLGLSYPGGPAVEQLALLGHPDKYHFPRPMTDRPGLDLSFSGLKTSVMNTISGLSLCEQEKADVALEFSRAVIETLVIKSKRAIRFTKAKRLVVSGGVSANIALRQALSATSEEMGCEVFFPSLAYATDNGAMIAFAGCQRLLRGESDGSEINIRPRWSLAEVRVSE